MLFNHKDNTGPKAGLGETEVCALGLHPPAVPREIPGVLWGQPRTVPGTRPLAPPPAVWGSLSDLPLGIEEGRHVLLSHKETVVSILGLSLTLSGVTWPGQLGPVLCASLWRGRGGDTAGVSMETAHRAAASLQTRLHPHERPCVTDAQLCSR